MHWHGEEGENYNNPYHDRDLMKLNIFPAKSSNGLNASFNFGLIEGTMLLGMSRRAVELLRQEQPKHSDSSGSEISDDEDYSGQTWDREPRNGRVLSRFTGSTFFDEPGINSRQTLLEAEPEDFEPEVDPGVKSGAMSREKPKWFKLGGIRTNHIPEPGTTGSRRPVENNEPAGPGSTRGSTPTPANRPEPVTAGPKQKWSDKPKPPTAAGTKRGVEDISDPYGVQAARAKRQQMSDQYGVQTA